MRSKAIDTPPLQLYTSSYFSSSLNRFQPVAWAVPHSASAHPNRLYPMLLLLHGRNCNYLSWAKHTKVLQYAAHYEMVVAFAEGGEGWYTDSADGMQPWETDIISSLVPWLRKHLPLHAPGRCWAVGGMSMGGYGAIKLSLKYTSTFATGVSHGGAFEITRREGAHPVFGDFHGDMAHRKLNDVYALAEAALCKLPTERPSLWIDCGTEDELLPVSRRFHQHLEFTGYGHQYYETNGHHTWPYWNRALRRIMPELDCYLNLQGD